MPHLNPSHLPHLSRCSLQPSSSSSISTCTRQSKHLQPLLNNISNTPSTWTSRTTTVITAHQKRHAATTRRTTKSLRVAPSATAAPASKYLQQQQQRQTKLNSNSNSTSTPTLIFNPPPSAPSPYKTPPLFLPAGDPRKQLLAQSHAFDNPYASGSRALPPPVRRPAPESKKYHLSEADIEEIRALRASDPWEWTVPKLAERFGCSRLFIGIAAPASQQRKDWGEALHQRYRERWGNKRRDAVEDRHKRRTLWEKDM